MKIIKRIVLALSLVALSVSCGHSGSNQQEDGNIDMSTEEAPIKVPNGRWIKGEELSDLCLFFLNNKQDGEKVEVQIKFSSGHKETIYGKLKGNKVYGREWGELTDRYICSIKMTKEGDLKVYKVKEKNVKKGTYGYTGNNI